MKNPEYGQKKFIFSVKGTPIFQIPDFLKNYTYE